MDAIATALDWEDAEAPLVPGRGNSVQVMNLHRAKGLEAKVVFLAAPFGERDWPPNMRVARDETGVARGTIPMTVKRGFTTEIVAQPGSWEEDQAVEREFEEAEKVRLLYVAATRARDELWVGRGAGLRVWGKSPWGVLEEWVVGAAVGEGGVARVVELPRRGSSRAGCAGCRDGYGGGAGGDGGRGGADARGDVPVGDGDGAGEGGGGGGGTRPLLLQLVDPRRGLRARDPPARQRAASNGAASSTRS